MKEKILIGLVALLMFSTVVLGLQVSKINKVNKSQTCFLQFMLRDEEFARNNEMLERLEEYNDIKVEPLEECY